MKELEEDEKPNEVELLDYNECFALHEAKVVLLIKEVKRLGFTFHRGFFKLNETKDAFVQGFAKTKDYLNELHLWVAFSKGGASIFIFGKSGIVRAVVKANEAERLINDAYIEDEINLAPSDSKKIYVMKNKSNGYYKIGISKDPFFREKTLQSQEPDVELQWKCLGEKNDEKLLHSIFKEKRLRGEWFRLSESDVEYIKSLKWTRNG